MIKSSDLNLKFLMKNIFIYFAFITPILAHASNWYFINDRNPEGITFFDKESLTASNGTVTLWVQKIKMDGEIDEDYSSKQKIKIDCKSRSVQLISIVNYNIKGIATYSSNNVGRVREVVPDSTGDYLLKVVCSKNFPNVKDSNEYFPVDNPIDAIKTIKSELSKSQK